MTRVNALRSLLALPAMLLLAACPAERERVVIEREAPDPAAQPVELPGGPGGPLTMEISLRDRQLYVLENGSVTATHPVAIGQDEYPTPPGEYRIDTVILNPEWIPPDSEWAADEERAAPGDPENPLGHAQLVYQRPYSIHGTYDDASLGTAASHGSVRVSNRVAEELAELAMRHGGVQRPEEEVRLGRENRSRERTNRLPNPIPLSIYERSRDGG
jgi:lipoprotein-anchoring transpeptidase ErfK/SrfK